MRRSTVPIRKGQPTPGDAHVSTPLTNISVAYIQAATAFVADKVFPTVPVQNQANVFYTFNKDDFFRDEAKPRSPASESAGGGFGLSTDTYACVVEAYHKDVDDQLRANADSVLSLDKAAAEFALQKMLIRRERRWQNSFFKAGVWGTDSTPGTLWSAANSTPRKNVDDGKNAVLKQTGYEPNTLTMSSEVLAALRSNSDVRDQFKYVSAESIDEAMLARYFGIEKVYVMKSVYQSAAEGASSSMAFVAGKHALLSYAPAAPSLMTPSAGYMFNWVGFTGAVAGIRTKKFRVEPLASDRIECEMAYDAKLVASALGYFFESVVS